MKRSSSNPTLNLLHKPGTLKCNKAPGMCKALSSNSLTSMDIYASDLTNRIQLEAMTKSSAYNMGMCYAEYGRDAFEPLVVFPVELLESTHLKENPDSHIEHHKDAMMAFMTCLVTPHEHVEMETSEQNTEGLLGPLAKQKTSKSTPGRRRTRRSGDGQDPGERKKVYA